MIKKMKHKFFNQNYFKEFIRLILLSFFVGIIFASFFKFSVMIEQERSYFIYFPLLFPFIIYIQNVFESKYKSTVSSVKYSLIENSSNFISSLYVYLFTLLGYICGASVGREGACVVIAEGLKPKMKLTSINWKFVLASIGFAGALGSFWLGPLFYLEVFILKLKNKIKTEEIIFIFFGSAIVNILMNKFNVSYFSFLVVFQKKWLLSTNFYWFLGSLILIIGIAAILFKFFYFKLSAWVNRQPLRFKIFLAAIVGLLFIVPVLRIFQGLGLSLIDHSFISIENSAFVAIGKMITTILSLSLGFLGGEFVPALIIGSALGQIAGAIDPELIFLGSALGFFMFFGCITQLYWVCFLAVALHFGWQIGILFSILLWFSQKISGSQSVYFQKHKA